MKSIDANEFNKMVKLKDYEVFDKNEILSFAKSINDNINKSLTEDEKNAALLELKSFTPIQVWDYKKEGYGTELVKSIKFYRESQVDWDIDEDGNIMKARSGKYTNTDLNRKLGRVGAKYGEVKEGEDKKREEAREKHLSNLDNYESVVSLHHNNNTKIYNDMKTQELKNKVVSQLVKWGNNEIEANKMVELHFDYASKHYSSVKTIAECIRTIY